jgi:lipoprotein-releasing system permease protein
LKVTVAAGKSFAADSAKLLLLQTDPDVFTFSQTVEENVMVQYGDQQEIAVMKGVDDQYSRVTGMDTMIYEGQFDLWVDDVPHAVAGLTMAYKLKVGLHFVTPLHFWIVRNKPTISLNPEKDLNDKYIYPSGKFAIDEDIDSRYIIVPIEFARSLLDNDTITGAIEIKLKPGANDAKVQQRVSAIFGDGFKVKTTYQQKEFEYKILKSEKFMAFMILSFILLIASFNVVGSLSMLMIEKKNDMFILQSMGTDKQMLSNIFMIQGWMIVMSGAIAGLLLGALLCWLQIGFGFFKVSSSGTYIIDAYPVALRLKDFVMILIAVVVVSFLTIYFPVKYFVKKYIIS